MKTLSEENLDYANLEIIDAGICAEFVSFVEDAQKLIIVDAIRGDKEPGTIYQLGVDDVMTDSPVHLCSHDVNVVDSLRMLREIRKELRDIIIFGIEPRHMDLSLELSPEVKRKLPELKRMVIEEINKTRSATV